MQLSKEQAQKMAEEYTKAWCSHDAHSVASFFASDGSLLKNDGEVFSGREKIAGMVQAFYDDFPNLVVTMNGIRFSGSHAVYLWTITGTNTVPGGTGNRVEFEGWEYWQYAGDGLIAESRGHFNASEFQKQLTGINPT